MDVVTMYYGVRLAYFYRCKHTFLPTTCLGDGQCDNVRLSGSGMALGKARTFRPARCVGFFAGASTNVRTDRLAGNSGRLKM
jgi:hypothetical protein